MPDSLAALVLAAGAGTRLQPLTRIRPKALCPVGNIALVDAALERARRVTPDVAVNVHHGRRQLEAHLEGRAHLSIEVERALGTAGALGHLRAWLAGRPVLVLNVDAWHDADLAGFVAGWDGARVRLLVVGDAQLVPTTEVVAALHPWTDVCRLPAEPSGLYERSWRDHAAAGTLDLASYDGPFRDCGTPARYLAANMSASGGAPVVGPGATVDGALERSVVWPGATVRRGERLRDAIRADDRLTVYVR
jgi:mannose-1-phosphate guanylyltransferase/MurNAc alpha-1-phosphate uridylyltransferase